MTNSLSSARFILLIAVLAYPFGAYAYAETFDPNFIISDEEVENYEAMSLSEIYDFLQKKNSSLPYYYIEDYDGFVRTAPEIIWLAAKRYAINPKYTLVLLQKEQSLVENPTPTTRDLDWATGYGICDTCATTDPAIQKYRGFGKQIDNGVGFMRFFLDNPQKSEPFTIGKTIEVNDRVNGNLETHSVTPVNQATANLYKYTPHYQGNYNFWKIWRSYFGQEYPDGSLVKTTGAPDVWLIQNGMKRHFKSFAILLSRYNPERILTIDTSDLEAFAPGPEISFPQFSYLRLPSGTVYLIIDDVKHGFDSPEALRILGVNPEEIIDVTDEALAPYTEGEPITIASAYPTGALLQDRDTGGVYYVENGKKFPIWSREIMDTRFPNKKIIQVTPEELESYPQGSPVTFAEGALIKSAVDPTVYVISNGIRIPIASEAIFNRLGYDWNRIITTTERAVSIHPLGQALN